VPFFVSTDKGGKEVKEKAEQLRKAFNIPPKELLVVLTIKGNRARDCVINCDDCLLSTREQCFPATSGEQRKVWTELMNNLLEGGRK